MHQFAGGTRVLAQTSENITDAFELFVSLLSEGRYYDAHEAIETLWYPRRFDNENEVKVWKGFINAAVSFELIKRGRSEPSEKAWKTYLKYRERIEGIVTPHKELYVRIAQFIEQHRGILCPNF